MKSFITLPIHSPDGKWIILDRDGVINEDSKDYIKSPAEWLPIPKSLEAIARLTAHHFNIAIATNQSGIGHGYYSFKTLSEIHEKMLNALNRLGGKIQGIFYCPHLAEDQCQCRKPLPGLLLEIEKTFDIDLKSAVMIGDSYRDIQAAKSVHVEAFLVKTGNGKEALENYSDSLQSVLVFENLSQTADFLIQREYI